MTFKEIKPNYPVHILDIQSVSYYKGRVVQVSFPRYPTPQEVNLVGKGMVVDVTIEANGRTANYTIPENLRTTYNGNLTISTEADGILKEVENVNRTLEQELSQIDHKKEIYQKTSTLMEELNPVFKEKKETEQRFSNIEGNVNDLKSMMSEILRELKGTSK